MTNNTSQRPDSLACASARLHRSGSGRLDRWVRRARPGAVLIFVVTLLTLLALVGVGLIANTHADRQNAVSARENTDLDLQVESVLNTVSGLVVAQLFDASNPQFYRDPVAGAGTYNHYAYHGDDEFRVLSARTPSRLSLAGGNEYRWPSISIVPPFAAATVQLFADPNSGFENIINPNGRQLRTQNGYRIDMPTSLGYPGYADVNGNDVFTGHVTRPGADADGDGVPDSYYFQIAPNTYAAVRVVDNNAAINLSTANDYFDRGVVSPYDLVYFSGRPGGVYTTHVGLGRYMRTVGSASELLALNRWRFGYLNSAGSAFTPRASGLPVVDHDTSPYWQKLTTAGAPDLDYEYTSQGEAMFFQLARRPGRPLINANDAHEGAPRFADASDLYYRAVPMSESAALAYRFVLIRPEVLSGRANHASLIENRMPTAAGLNALALRGYAPRSTGYTNLDAWYANFDYNATSFAERIQTVLRPELVARNGVSNAIVRKSVATPAVTATLPNVTFLTDSGTVEGMTPYGVHPVRTDANTAEFGELWRAYWCVMTLTGELTPFGAPANYNRNNGSGFGAIAPYADSGTSEQRMFRDVIRWRDASDVGDNTTQAGEVQLLPYQVLQLRAAIAAVNTEYLRSPQTSDPLPRTIYLQGTIDTDAPNNQVLPSSPNGPNLAIKIYPTIRQPFITEVYANNNNVTDLGSGNNPNGYVAIELHNPYTVDLDVSGLEIHTIDRSNMSSYTAYSSPRAPAYVIPANTMIAAGGYLVIENHNPTTPAAPGAIFRPAAAGTPAASIYAPNLHQVFAREMVLVKVITSGTTNHFMPLDSFDFTGFPTQVANDNATAWHYVRANAAAARKTFHCVYPGRYDGRKADRRQQGTQEEVWTQIAGSTTEDDGWSQAQPSPAIALGTADATATHPHTFPIQLNNVGFGGLNKPQAAATNRFPFGQFARVGDLMQVTYIGAYEIFTNPAAPGVPALLEVNSVTMDASRADDTISSISGGPTDPNKKEQIGRFCPMTDERVYDVANNPEGIVQANDTYNWAVDLFDYFTVWNAPHADYSPHYNPNDWVAAARPRQAVNRRSAIEGSANGTAENTLPVEGLININTASERVLATVPWITFDATFAANPDEPLSNYDIARAIVEHRRQYGPFTSLFDLNQVRGLDRNGTEFAIFQRGITNDGSGNGGDPIINLETDDINDDEGDISPSDPSGATVASLDGVYNDFETRYARLIRVSNIITTKSDHFRAYILVEKWEGGINAADRRTIAERRICVDIDRSNVTRTQRIPRIYRLYSE